jgi:hypothetical protein
VAARAFNGIPARPAGHSLPRRRRQTGTRVCLGRALGDSRDPATVRPRLAEAAAEGLEGIRKTLLDAATGAVRDHWITFECGECGARKRVEVPVPDVRARVAAIELLLREGLGRPPQAEEVPVAQFPTNVGAVTKMSWDELQILGATLFASEITAVMNGTSDGLLRDRLAVLSSDERRVLREALGEPEFA